MPARRSPPGTYLLLLRLDVAAELPVGRSRRAAFPPGWYVYAGSALGGLETRLRRHAQQVKPRHWHVDALREVAELVAVAVRIGPERLECSAAARVATLPGGRIIVRRFGASDCRCPGHLVHFDQPPGLRLDSEWTVMPTPMG